LQRPVSHAEGAQQSASVVQVAPVTPQQVLVAVVAVLENAQIRFVSLEQHCRFVWHGAPTSRASQAGHFFLHFFFFLASVLPVAAASPAAATAAAAVVPSADLSAPRRVLAS
jgi:hypothetical protein